MLAKRKKRSAISGLLRWVVCLLVISALCWGVVEGINIYYKNALDIKIEEVNAANDRISAQYHIAMAEYENATRTGEGVSWPRPPSEGVSLQDLSTYPMENTVNVTVTRQELLEGGLILVNHWHSLPADFSDANIKGVRESTTGYVPLRDNRIKLFPQAAKAIEAMVLDAAELDLKDYIVQNAYRTMEEQQKLFDDQAKSIRDRNPNMSEDLVVERAKQSVNYPGTSEYQTGFSFEMKLYNKDDSRITGTRFPDSDQGRWFNENCWKYGVIFRFPAAGYPLPGTDDKSFITGNSSKLNIYRYVGVAHSTAMKILNMCLEEYIDYLIQNPHFAIYDNGRLMYEVYRQPYGGGDAQVQRPRAATSFVSSVDNMGGVVTAYYYD